jgi:hypothetical protein
MSRPCFRLTLECELFLWRFVLRSSICFALTISSVSEISQFE